MNIISKIGFLVSCGILIASCEPDVQIPKTKETPVYGINFSFPEGWPSPLYNFEQNKLTEEGFRLGRKLFYEKRLSRDNTISCGSCHQQFAAFSHSAHSVSHGIDGLLGTRNAPGLFNLNWHPTFMWDGGINHIEVQPLAPIANPVEMDEDFNNVITKLNDDEEYKLLFKEAFGDETINSERILKAIAQFQGMLLSANSKYDKYIQGKLSLSTSEINGLSIFRQKCNSCHKEPLFSDFSYRNNGLAIHNAYKDSGRAHISGASIDRYKFKVPSLRNIAVTAPYMHDGRFNSLMDCLDHYTSGIYQTENLDTLLTNGIVLTAQEKQDVIMFLQTLTDNNFLSDGRFADPN